MIELLFMALLLDPNFHTHIAWDPVPEADHYWICFSDDPREFTKSLVETEAVCAPVLDGTEYHHYGGFGGRYASDIYYFSVLSCNEAAGCGGF